LAAIALRWEYDSFHLPIKWMSQRLRLTPKIRCGKIYEREIEISTPPYVLTQRLHVFFILNTARHNGHVLLTTTRNLYGSSNRTCFCTDTPRKI
jgi:hypothetical protein